MKSNSTKSNAYLIVDKKVLPEVYEKVLYANALLESGEAASTSEAVRLAGISRSVYYKYKDCIHPYTKKDSSGILTVQVILLDRPGILVNFLSVFYEANANILTVNQSIPVKDRAFVSVSARAEHLNIELDELLARLKAVKGVLKIDSIVD
ncbi:ACT domain-containing protein [Bacilliculturomica massiliensis]|uniref:ACT domain-containing protein n=1 Tax=Bacilliculturomica massiliensis TaxID=1917867 RepID=UPI001030A9EB|nr:ACT domain-containing protein [Bacilliculturomica massiliensis]